MGEEEELCGEEGEEGGAEDPDGPASDGGGEDDHCMDVTVVVCRVGEGGGPWGKFGGDRTLEKKPGRG